MIARPRESGRYGSSLRLEHQVDLSNGLSDVPGAATVGRKENRVAGRNFDARTVFVGKAAAPRDEMTELGFGDLPLPDAGRAFPDTAFDPLVVATGQPASAQSADDRADRLSNRSPILKVSARRPGRRLEQSHLHLEFSLPTRGRGTA